MWACYALAACFVCYFISKVAEAMRERDARLAEARGWMAQNERLAALSSFSANAAHELGTPLATIRLVANELVRALEKRGGDDALRADAALIHAEVERCRRILSDLAAKAGDSVGEAPVATTPSQVLEESLRLALGARPMAVRVSYGNDAWAEAPVVVPAKTLAQMIANLLRNAVDAQAAERSEEPVELHVAVDDDWRVVVRDRGPGLSPSLRTRLGKPFVTTKRDGGGLGLGVYLVSTFAERCGGSLRFAPREGGGLEAILSLPRNALKGAS
jgi:two-component system sensor histidine kinase RegB